MSLPYFELHNHSHFSYLDGVSNPKDMARRAKELGYPAIALTDHGVIDGWYDFYKNCKEQGVIPILSCEFYIAYNIDDKEQNPFKKEDMRTKRGHLIVHSKGNEGLDALKSLYNSSWSNYKDQGKKQIIFETDLVKYAGKILVQSACTGSYITDEDKVKRFKDTFGDDFYLEIQPHKLDQDYNMDQKCFLPCEDKQLAHNTKIIEWARKYDVNLIVTGDAHYPTQEDKKIQDILIKNSFVGQSTGWHFFQDTNFLMNGEKWWELFCAHHPTLVEDIFTKDDFNKALVTMHGMIEKCKGVVLEKTPTLRKFELATHPLFKEGDTAEKLISRIIKDVGLIRNEKEYNDRLVYEMKVIKEKGFLDYFLIQEDIIRWNREQNYLVGPARGSAAGCLVSYYMGITTIDPIKYDLLFERFLEIDRTDFPDIDIDYAEREATYEYVTKKYGPEFVMSVGAYQTIKIKTALKQAYKVLYENRDYDYQLINNVTSKIPDSNARGEGDQAKILGDLVEQSRAEFKDAEAKGVLWPSHNLYAFLMNKPDLVEAVYKLLGKVTNMRVHPCSVVISDKPVKEVLPCAIIKPGTLGEKWVTTFDGTAVEASGYLKFDLLGLNTLNCIQACVDEIIKYKGPILKGIDYTDSEKSIDISKINNIWKIEPNDPAVFEKMGDGDTAQVFQFNTTPLQNILRSMRAENFNDCVATVALVRPGPAKAGFPKLYTDRKFGNLGLNQEYIKEEITGETRYVKSPSRYSHPLMDIILKDTYNVITYQEQVQKIFVAVGGFTPVESNKIRKAISKGKKELINQSKPKFLEYATTKLKPAWTTEQVDIFYEDMIGFGSYCFNLSHSVAYAFIGYVCQFLKVYYPLEWWSGNLKYSGETGTEVILDIIKKNNYVPLVTADVNASKEKFIFDGKAIIEPLKQIDGVGEKGLPLIVENAPYASIEDFVARLPGRSVRKNCVIGLIIADAFRNVSACKGKTSAELLEYYLKVVKKEKEIPEDLQNIINDAGAMERKRCEVDPYYQSDWAAKFSHAFDARIVAIKDLYQYPDGAKVYIGGECIKKSYNPIKRGDNAGKKMCFLTIRQANETIKITLWPQQIEKMNEILDKVEGMVIQVKGTVTRYQGNLGLQGLSIKEVVIG